ncbi:YfhD family protein [Bacillus sp. V5-8f]|uniref:YfhD family protein n=1 Tax=Bacillus sp. V5-8f TaxID=2053044 RepID=UPI000C776E96|nr:YfhD family protein [Bacillus sp. V5-8f]PLT33003.1 YfhD family protein [Bacillus sp. V5-8f]
MGRNSIHHNRDKNKQRLPQVPKNLKRDGLDVEYSSELADHEDIEAQARSRAADERARNRQRNR